MSCAPAHKLPVLTEYCFLQMDFISSSIQAFGLLAWIEHKMCSNCCCECISGCSNSFSKFASWWSACWPSFFSGAKAFFGICKKVFEKCLRLYHWLTSALILSRSTLGTTCVMKVIPALTACGGN